MTKVFSLKIEVTQKSVDLFKVLAICKRPNRSLSTSDPNLIIESRKSVTNRHATMQFYINYNVHCNVQYGVHYSTLFMLAEGAFKFTEHLCISLAVNSIRSEFRLKSLTYCHQLIYNEQKLVDHQRHQTLVTRGSQLYRSEAFLKFPKKSLN